MYSITSRSEFEAAHCLSFYNGACKNLHGHSYKLEVSLFGECLRNAMLMDFKRLKSIVNEQILSKLDHACILFRASQDAFEQQLAALLEKYDKKIYYLEDYPTAENIAKHIHGILREQFKEEYKIEVVLYETSNNYAKYSE